VYIHASIAERKRRKHAQELIRYAAMVAITVLAIVAGFQYRSKTRWLLDF
jgi:hypothetical protein